MEQKTGDNFRVRHTWEQTQAPPSVSFGQLLNFTNLGLVPFKTGLTGCEVAVGVGKHPDPVDSLACLPDAPLHPALGWRASQVFCPGWPVLPPSGKAQIPLKQDPSPLRLWVSALLLLSAFLTPNVVVFCCCFSTNNKFSNSLATS